MEDVNDSATIYGSEITSAAIHVIFHAWRIGDYDWSAAIYALLQSSKR